MIVYILISATWPHLLSLLHYDYRSDTHYLGGWTDSYLIKVDNDAVCGKNIGFVNKIVYGVIQHVEGIGKIKSCEDKSFVIHDA